jgi:LAO/AO transport system kinase
MTLGERVLAGDVRAAARVMTLIENEAPEARAILTAIYGRTGSAHIVGITGPPGSGKSTLTDKLTEECRRRGLTVGIVAVDPTSPFTGGAILGDRIRMQRHSLDAGVFIRSMATRGHLGGLARATGDVVDVLDAMGKDVIFVETVGVGQDEVEVVRTAHTCVVVSVPGLGDDVQAIKAGIMEIGDLFVVNKADREGAERTVREIEAMLGMAGEWPGWQPKVLKTIAVKGEGLVEVADEIQAHRRALGEQGRLDRKRRDRAERMFFAALQEILTRRALDQARADGLLPDLLGRVAQRELDPYRAAEELLSRLGHR